MNFHPQPSPTDHNRAGSGRKQGEDSARKSDQGQPQKQINKIPQSNPTHNLANIQGKYSQQNSVQNTRNSVKNSMPSVGHSLNNSIRENTQ